MDIRIVEIDKYSDFQALEETWLDVLQRCDSHTIFSTLDWLSIWWKHFGRNKRLVILLAEDSGKIVGIAPLMYSVHSMFGLRQGKIEFIGTPDSDYNDFILANRREECIRSFISHLNNFAENWDCIELTDIPEDTQSLASLRRLTRAVKPIHACPHVVLMKSYETFLNDLSASQRWHIRRGLRYLEKDFEVNFVSCSGDQSIDEGMNVFFDLHQKRWNAAGLPGVFADQEFRSFHKDIAKSFSQKGWLGLFLLKISGKTVAALYGFKYKSRFYAYLSGFDPKYSKYSIGSVLTAHVFQNCMQNGLSEFDFMRGAEAYKDHWNTSVRWNHQAILTKKGFLSSIENHLYTECWRQGNRLKYLLQMKH